MLTLMEDVVQRAESVNTSADPAVGLRAVAALRVLVESMASLHVRHARDLGWSWQEIASALGVSRQAVHRKHAARRDNSVEGNGSVEGNSDPDASQ